MIGCCSLSIQQSCRLVDMRETLRGEISKRKMEHCDSSTKGAPVCIAQILGSVCSDQLEEPAGYSGLLEVLLQKAQE